MQKNSSIPIIIDRKTIFRQAFYIGNGIYEDNNYNFAVLQTYYNV